MTHSHPTLAPTPPDKLPTKNTHHTHNNPAPNKTPNPQNSNNSTNSPAKDNKKRTRNNRNYRNRRNNQRKNNTNPTTSTNKKDNPNTMTKHNSSFKSSKNRKKLPKYTPQPRTERFYSRTPNSVLQHKSICLAYNSRKGCRFPKGAECSTGARKNKCRFIHCTYSELCKYFFSGRGCFHGNACRHIHATLKYPNLYQFWRMFSHQNNASANSPLPLAPRGVCTSLSPHNLPTSPTALHVWDFDATLFHTHDRTSAQAVWKKKFPNQPWPKHLEQQWWGHEDSLSAPFDNVPEGPAFKLCSNELRTLNSHHKTGPESQQNTTTSTCDTKNNPNLLSVLMTGRHVDLRKHVLDILDSNGLASQHFSFLCFKPNDWPMGTIQYKCALLSEILNRYPSLKEVEIWEDRMSHVHSFYDILEKQLRKRNIKLHVHYVIPTGYERLCDFQKKGHLCDCNVSVS